MKIRRNPLFCFLSMILNSKHFFYIFSVYERSTFKVSIVVQLKKYGSCSFQHLLEQITSHGYQLTVVSFSIGFSLRKYAKKNFVRIFMHLLSLLGPLVLVVFKINSKLFLLSPINYVENKMHSNPLFVNVRLSDNLICRDLFILCL